MSDFNFLFPAPVATLVKSHSALQKGLSFFWRLAWKSRLRLPYLIIIAFMILDLRVTLEVIVDVPQDGDDDNDEIEGENDEDDDNGTEYSPDDDSDSLHEQPTP